MTAWEYCQLHWWQWYEERPDEQGAARWPWFWGAEIIDDQGGNRVLHEHVPIADGFQALVTLGELGREGWELASLESQLAAFQPEGQGFPDARPIHRRWWLKRPWQGRVSP